MLAPKPITPLTLTHMAGGALVKFTDLGLAYLNNGDVLGKNKIIHVTIGFLRAHAGEDSGIFNILVTACGRSLRTPNPITPARLKGWEGWRPCDYCSRFYDYSQVFKYLDSQMDLEKLHRDYDSAQNMVEHGWNRLGSQIETMIYEACFETDNVLTIHEVDKFGNREFAMVIEPAELAEWLMGG